MKSTERTPIVSQNGVTIYGRVGRNNKLGNFEVISEHGGHEGEFSTYAEAESKFKYLKSLKDNDRRN